MSNEIESRLNKIERQLARTKLLAGILLVIEIAQLFYSKNEGLKEMFLVSLLIIGGLIVSTAIIYLVERVFSTKD